MGENGIFGQIAACWPSQLAVLMSLINLKAQEPAGRTVLPVADSSTVSATMPRFDHSVGGWSRSTLGRDQSDRWGPGTGKHSANEAGFKWRFKTSESGTRRA